MVFSNTFLVSYFNGLSKDSINQIIYVCYIPSSLVMLAYSFKYTQRKINKIHDPQYNNSFCIITIRMLQLMKLMQVLQFILNIALMVLIATGQEVEHAHFQANVLSIALTTPFLMGRFVSILQAYEWILMVNIIQIQKDKALEEIMFEINNSESHLKFLRKEKIMRRIFHFVVFVYMTIMIVQNFLWFHRGEQPGKYYYLIIIFETYVPFILLLSSYITLSCKMNKYHKYEYQEIRQSLFVFILIETIDSLGPIIRYFFGYKPT